MESFVYLFKESLRGIWKNRLLSIACVGILVCCLLLTGAAVLFCMNLNALIDKVEDNNNISVFLNDGISKKEIKNVEAELKKTDNVRNVVFYSKEQGIKEFSKALGELYSEFDGEDNPLPDAYKITLEDLSEYNDTVARINKIDGVYKVSNRSGIAGMLTEVSNMVATMGLWVVSILILISVFIVSTAIRTNIYARRAEISIMKSVGATNAFVRTPFIIEGVLLGMVSGFISSVLLKFLYEALLNAFQIKSVSNVEIISFSSVAFTVFVISMVFGAVLGISGSVVSMGKYLRLEGNEALM